ncbi:MAG: hypothetical protein KJ737_09440 [Proteobacteria bacterium]|nr:hypothetical protein [Pseudomonadota bacterium]
MKYHREGTDRRKRNRYRLQQGAYAAFSPYYIKLGPIVNISLGGFACHYFIDRDQRDDLVEPYVSLRNNQFFIRDIPVKGVCNFEINMEESHYLKMMYCGVQFGQLTFEQFKAIDEFIIYNTLDILSDRRSAIQRRSRKDQSARLDLPRYSSFETPVDMNRRSRNERRNTTIN